MLRQGCPQQPAALRCLWSHCHLLAPISEPSSLKQQLCTGCKAEHWVHSFHCSAEASFPQTGLELAELLRCRAEEPPGQQELRQSPLPAWGSHTLHPLRGLHASSTLPLHGKQPLTDDEQKATQNLSLQGKRGRGRVSSSAAQELHSPRLPSRAGGTATAPGSPSPVL